MRICVLGLCLVSVVAACAAPAASKESAGSRNSADVNAYFAAKRAYAAEGLRRQASFDTPYYKEAVAALGERLHAVIKPDSVTDAPLTANLGSLYEGDEDSNALDGLEGPCGNARILVTTPELLAVWARSRGDSTSAGTAALGTENMLTWAFQDGMHVYPFGDVKAHASLPTSHLLRQALRRSARFAEDRRAGPGIDGSGH